MANFPSIAPSTRTFTPGSYPSSALPCLTGDETNIRHSNASVGHRLRMSFINITRANLLSIVNHYVTHGTFIRFDLNTTVLTATNLTFPANYQFRYLSRPTVTETQTQIDIDIELQLLPPYTV